MTQQITNSTEEIVLISNINRLKKLLYDENEKINLCIHILEQENKSYCQYLKELEIEIAHIRNDLKLNIVKNDVEEIIDTNLREELKQLYRKISQKCHPDKTSNKEHHELFKIAKKAYSKCDYSELRKIYEDLFEEYKSENKLDILKNQFKKIENDYIELRKKPSFIMTTLFNSDNKLDKMKSKKMFLDLLFSKIFELETLKSNLK